MSIKDPAMHEEMSKSDILDIWIPIGWFIVLKTAAVLVNKQKTIKQIYLEIATEIAFDPSLLPQSFLEEDSSCGVGRYRHFKILKINLSRNTGWGGQREKTVLCIVTYHLKKGKRLVSPTQAQLSYLKGAITHCEFVTARPSRDGLL